MCGALFAGVAYRAAVILGALVTALLINQVKINLNIVGAVPLMLSGAIWLIVSLSSSREQKDNHVVQSNAKVG